jgi:hypothetical protein
MNLIIEFTDKSESFTLGVELGRILNKLENGIEFINNNDLPIHTKNIDVLRQSCNFYGYTPEFKSTGHFGWTYFYAKKNFNNN